MPVPFPPFPPRPTSRRATRRLAVTLLWIALTITAVSAGRQLRDEMACSAAESAERVLLASPTSAG